MTKTAPSRRDGFDPEVFNLLKEMEQRQSESQLPRREREKKAKERLKISARRDRRATYDLPPSIRNRISALSGQLSVPASQLVTLALIRFLESYDDGALDLSEYKLPSRSPRYDWNLVFPELKESSKKNIKK
jgi:hypothetical protein